MPLLPRQDGNSSEDSRNSVPSRAIPTPEPAPGLVLVKTKTPIGTLSLGV